MTTAKRRKQAANIAKPEPVQQPEPKAEFGPSARGVVFASKEYQNWQTRISQTVKGEARVSIISRLRDELNYWLEDAPLEELYFVMNALCNGNNSWDYTEWQLVGGIIDELPQSIFADKWPEEEDDWTPKVERVRKVNNAQPAA